MNIYLTGYMASGKSYLGRQLAEKLDIPFYDLDAVIEARSGQSIAAIFETEGESAFRKIEAEALRSIPASARAVVSCGGGTFCFEANRDWIHQQGISIYLKVSSATLVQRLSKKEEDRPIIKANNNSLANLLTFVEKHLASRKEDYEAADIVYIADGPAEEIISELSDYFQRFLKS